MTLDELGQRMTWREFRLRMVSNSFDPIGRRRADYNAASIAQQIARIAAILTEGRAPSLADMLLYFTPEEVEERRQKRLAAELESFAMTRMIEADAQAAANKPA